MTPSAEIDHVKFGFGDFIVHKDISISVNPGETVTILGPSGTGKTIILKLIMGLLKPQKGEVRIMGRSIGELPEEELTQVRRDVGMLFQGAALFDSLTVFENIAFGLRERGEKSESTIKDIVEERLNVVGLPNIAHKYPPQLSGGQKKRVGLARALASSPKIMLLDEPTTGLDPTATRLIDDLIIKLRDTMGLASVAVTHDIASARRISDRWVLINNGLVAAQGKVDELTASNEDVIRFTEGRWEED